MKTVKILFIFLLAITTNTFAQTSEGTILGKWESDKKDVKFEIFKQGDRYFGKFLWGNQIVESDGVTSKKDTKNPDVKLRSRDLIGITSLTDLKWDGKEYVDGKIYNAPTGDTYSCKVWVKEGKMYLRGYMGISILGKTASFHRIK